MFLLVAICFLIININQTNGQVTSFFSKDDIPSLENNSNKLLTASDVYHYLTIISGFNLDKSKVCKQECNSIIKNSLVSNGKENDYNNYYSIYYAAASNKICQCSGLDLSPSIKTAIKAAPISSLNSVREISGVILAADLLDLLTPSLLDQCANTLKKFLSPDGTFKETTSSSSGTTQGLTTALDALVVLYKSGTHKEFVSDVYEKAFQLVPNGDGEFAADPLLVVPLSKLTDKKLRLVGARLISVTEGLLLLRHSHDLQIVSRVLEGLRYITSYKAQPVVVVVPTRSFSVSQPSGMNLKISLFDCLGSAITPSSAEVISVKSVGKDGSFLAGTQLDVSKPLSVDLSSLGLNSGRYSVTLSLLVSEQSGKPVNHQSFFVVTEDAKVAEVSAGISDSASFSRSDLQQLNSPGGLDSSLEGSATNLDYFHVEYTVASVEGTPLKKPHQSFVRFTHTISGKSVYFVGKRSASAGEDNNNNSLNVPSHRYSLSVAIGNEAEKFARESGDYEVTILAADLTYRQQLQFSVGKLKLKFPSAPSTHLPLYAKSLLHSSDVTLKPLPEITHVMRPPAVRASDFMAAVFTALTIAPLVGLVLFLFSLSPNLKRLTSLSSVVFVVCITATLGLYVAYWFSLPGVSFYQTIYYLCILFPTTVVAGRYSLASVTAVRLASASTTTKSKSE